MNNIKYVALTNAITQSVGCLCVLLATYITKNANCLWALVIVCYLGMAYNSKKDDDSKIDK